MMLVYRGDGRVAHICHAANLSEVLTDHPSSLVRPNGMFAWICCEMPAAKHISLETHPTSHPAKSTIMQRESIGHHAYI